MAVCLVAPGLLARYLRPFGARAPSFGAAVGAMVATPPTARPVGYREDEPASEQNNINSRKPSNRAERIYHCLSFGSSGQSNLAERASPRGRQIRLGVQNHLTDSTSGWLGRRRCEGRAPESSRRHSGARQQSDGRLARRPAKPPGRSLHAAGGRLARFRPLSPRFPIIWICRLFIESHWLVG